MCIRDSGTTFDNHYQVSNYNSNDYYYYKEDGTRAKIEDKMEEKK